METSLDKSALAGAPAGTGTGAAAQPAAKVQRTVYSVLGAISFSHLLNDMIQSLILAIYPMLKDNFSLSFGQIGLITLTYQITASLLQPLVGSYTRQASEAVFAARRHGLHACRTVADVGRAQLRRAAGGGGTGRLRFVGVPSGIVAGGAHGVGRTARARAVAVSGRRQCGFVARPAARRVDRDSARPAQHRVVFGGRARRDRRADADRPLVQGASVGEEGAQRRRSRHAVAQQGHVRNGRADPAGVLEVFLSGQHQQLLHLLSDRQVPSAGAGRAGSSVRVPAARSRWAP